MISKHFWLEQSTLKPSAGRPSMRDCFNWLEDCSNDSAGVLQTYIPKNMSSITGRGVESQMQYVPKQNKWFNKWHNQSSMLPSTKTLLYDASGLQCSFLWLLSKKTHSNACKTNRIVTGFLHSIETITHAWSVSALSQKHKKYGRNH